MVWLDHFPSNEKHHFTSEITTTLSYSFNLATNGYKAQRCFDFLGKLLASQHEKKITSILVASSLYMAAPLAHAEGALDTENFSANIALTSNYIFRGVSLSNNDPAVSGGFDWGYNGLYLGTWASSITSVQDESFEIDYYGGYGGEINGIAYSLDYIYYEYPGDTGTPTDLAYYEFGGSLGYTFAGSLEPTIGVSVMHSPDFYVETGSATAIEGSFGLSLAEGFGLGVYNGNQDLEESEYGIDGYDYYGISLSKSVGIFDLSVSYADTDSNGESFQGGDTGEVFFTVGAFI
jgi:uncharacterized protein (TIGR02001 family)